MRLLLAGLFVFMGISLSALFLLPIEDSWHSSLLAGPVIGVLFLLLCVVALIVFNPPGSPWLVSDPEAYIRELEEKGLLAATDFRATRAFEVAEYEDEGSHYFIELEDGAVLYLNGQYLYDYEPVEDDPELNQPRQFPCTDFTIRRHRKQGFVVDVICRGHVLEPETVAPPLDDPAYWQSVVLEDGHIIGDRSYDEIKERAR